MTTTDPITEQDITSIYNTFLGRPPESIEVVQRHINAKSNKSDFLAKILQAPEFYRHNFRALARYILSGAPPSNPGEIESECEIYQLEKLFEHVRSVWSKLGEVQPHFSVLSAKQFAPNAIASNTDAFYESGRHEIAATIDHLTRLGLTINPNGSGIELGCGVGRVTRFLSNHLKQVTGYDVSPSHIALARDYVKTEDVPNVQFERIDQLPELDFLPHTFFYSKIVLQHNPPPVMLYILNKVFSRTLPGGVVVFQLPTAIRGYSFNVSEYLETCQQITDMEIHCLPQASVFKTMIEHRIMPVDVYRDGSLTGFDRVSMTFIGKKALTIPKS